MNNKQVILSIVTVCYNDSKNLLSTINSVRKIKSDLIEFVIIDGGSVDRTSEYVKENEDIIDVFLSENDNGIFDAMNKGVNFSNGKWVIFINAGDLINLSAEFIRSNLEQYDSYALVYGNTNYLSVGVKKPFPATSLRYGLIMACHQSMLFNQRLLGDDLYYLDDFKLINDYELTCRIISKNYKVKYVDTIIATFIGGGISSQVNWEARKARYTYVYRYFGLSGVLTTLAESFSIISLPKRVS